MLLSSNATRTYLVLRLYKMDGSYLLIIKQVDVQRSCVSKTSLGCNSIGTRGRLGL